MSALPSSRDWISFTEEMQGFVSHDASTFGGGYREGKAHGEDFMFHLTILVDDLDRFLSEPSHEARATGYVRGRLVGGECTLSSASFNLFVTNPETGLKEMHYRLHFSNAQSEPYTLLGLKVIRGWPLSQILADSTTLYTILHRGHVRAGDEDSDTVFGLGILRIGLWGTLRLVFSMRASAPTLPDRIRALWRFGCFFLGTLWRS